MTPDQYRIAQEEELQAAAPIGNAPVAIPAPPLPEVPPYMPRGYSSRADEAAAAAAERDRASKDSEAKVADARSLINKAFGGSAGDLAAPIRATREDGIKDITRRRLQEDQDRARSKEQHDALEQEALSRGDSPESQKVKELFSSTIVGKRLRGQMGEEAWARLPGHSIPGGKDLLASDTELLKSSGKPGNPEDDLNSPASRSMQLGFSTFLKNSDPKKYEQYKDIIPTLSANAIKNLGSVVLRKEGLDAPRMIVQFNPNDGTTVTHDSKHPNTPPLPGTLAPGEQAPPGETPRETKDRKKKILDLGAPTADFEWGPDILSGKKPPPPGSLKRKADDTADASATILDFGVEIGSFLQKHPNGMAVGDDAARVDPFVQAIRTMVRRSNDMGVYRAYDKPLLDQIVRDPTDLKNIIFSMTGIRDANTGFEALLKETKQRAWSTYHNIGIDPAKVGRWSSFQPVTAPMGDGTAPAGPGGGRTWVKDQRNKATGEVRGVYSDGSFGAPHGS